MTRAFSSPLSLATAMLTGAMLSLAMSAGAAAPRKAPPPHRTRLMPYVEVPVEHGLWLFAEMPCNTVSNAAGPMMWFPAPPQEDSFLDCAPGMKQIGPASYQSIGCPGDGAGPSTYKVISRTRMIVDGDAMRLCPVAQLPEPFRTTVLEQLSQERARR